MQQDDYPSAAKRHLKDAGHLEDQGRIDNADHLYGISAECALKSALVMIGAFNDSHKTHIDVLWRRVYWAQLQRMFPELASLSGMQEPFSDWRVSQRYWADGAVSPEMLEKHKTMTKRIAAAVGLVRG